MFDDWLNPVPEVFTNFILVTLFSLLIGLEQRRRYIQVKVQTLFGTDRTFTVIGILGFVLYIISPQNFIPFLSGLAAVTIFLLNYYYQKIKIHQRFGLTTIIIALITYCLAPLIYTQQTGLVIFIVVAILLLTEAKETLFELSKKFDSDEFIILAKFLVIAGVILPIVPKESFSPSIAISPYKFWLSIVAVSGISYISYLLKKFVFPNAGIVITGILGGLYSSTATTIILSKKSKSESISDHNKTIAAIILATAMMYVRIFMLAFFLNMEIAKGLFLPFLICVGFCLIVAFYFLRHKDTEVLTEVKDSIKLNNKNPLEFKTAFVFSILFVIFGLATTYMNEHYGTNGVNILSLIVGITDIDPFILSLFQSKSTISHSVVIIAVINATTSNNLVKLLYGLFLGSKKMRVALMIAFVGLIIMSIIMSMLIF